MHAADRNNAISGSSSVSHNNGSAFPLAAFTAATKSFSPGP